MVELKGLFGGITMYNLLLTLLLVMSAIIVIAVFMQPQKNPSSNVFDGGGAEALFERSKPRLSLIHI